MDGICGTIGGAGDREEAEKYLDRVVSWTGSGDRGRFFDGRLALCVTGNTSAAEPSPLYVSEDGAVRIAFIGEVRNAAEARALLEDRGHRFRVPSCPGELLHRLIQSGDRGLLAGLDGIWCFALWDARAERLTLVSDRTGMRPFHYFAHAGSLVFSTSLKGVLAHPSVPRALDTDVLREIFEIGVIVPPDTMVRDVKVLRAGDSLEFGREVTIRRRPPRNLAPGASIDERERADLYFHTLERAVLDSFSEKRRPALLLSGGIDSGAIASIAHRHGVRLRSHTIDVSEDGVESSGARRLAGLCGTDHRETTRLAPDVMESLPEAVWLQESVGVNSVNAVTELAFARSLDPELDVVVTGDGNDLGWGIWTPDAPWGETEASFAKLYASVRGVVPKAVVERVLRPAHGDEALLRKIESARLRTGSLVNDLIALDCEIYGENGPNKMVGRLRLDPSPQPYRFPFLDSRLWRLIDALPVEDKLSIESGAATTKVLMKRALEKHRVLPDDIIHRKKTWMASPSTRWLRSESGKLAERILFRRDAALARHVDLAFVRELWREHRARPRWWRPRARGGDHTVALMMLLALEIWLRLFLESRSLAAPARLGEI